MPLCYSLSVVQTLTLQSLVTILNSTKSSEIQNIVKALDSDQQDTLMKYLYKGMGMPGWGDVSGSVLLGWHEKVRVQRARSREAIITHESTPTAHRGRGYRLHSACYDRPPEGLRHAAEWA